MIADYRGLAIAQAAKTLEMTIHPLKTGGVGNWNHACEKLPSNLPTQAFKGTFVTDPKVTCFQDHFNAHQFIHRIFDSGHRCNIKPYLYIPSCMLRLSV